MSNLTPIAPGYASAGKTTLVFKEKKGLTLTGDSAKVHDEDGNLAFEIKAKKMTLSERRTIVDATGTELGQLRKKKTPGVHATVYVGTMADEKKCAVKKTGLMDITKCSADIYLGDSVIGNAVGNWRAKSYKINIDGNQVAEVARKTGVAGHLLSADSYHIDVIDGVDTAFMVLVVIALDELYHDDN